MEKVRVHYSCDSAEVSNTTGAIRSKFAEEDWTADLILSKILADIAVEHPILEQAIEAVRGNTLKANVRAEDEKAGKDYICLKNFIKANLYAPEAETEEAAKEIWKLIVNHNPKLDRQNYARQIELSNSLLANLKSPTFKPLVDLLTGVPERVEKFTTSTASLQSAYKELATIKSEELDLPAPSAQKDKLRTMINERLMPYLEGAVDALPEKYEATYKAICESIEINNEKARARQTLKESQKEKEPEEDIA
ncbi:hypothetical protein DF185_09790 [Marinifilum breve]|uniref:Uncharacterized protein n=1 Tax=Marinifilum breve TaxID=2184082 RepID=A0A2V3ZZJ1_9BACT|nr:DUF6261 family protein [Marinifilum breve]PXY01746.1 hypothetical protein DF185_09790 [Marinifilum breve]